MKTLFVIVAASITGVTLGVGLIATYWKIWSASHERRDEKMIVAHLKGLSVKSLSAAGAETEFRYSPQNTTRHDTSLSASGTTLYVRRKDGTLIDMKRFSDYKQEDLTLPAGESVEFIIKSTLPAASGRSCELDFTVKLNDQQFLDYFNRCFRWIGGFVLFSDNPKVRIAMSIDEDEAPTKK